MREGPGINYNKCDFYFFRILTGVKVAKKKFSPKLRVERRLLAPVFWGLSLKRAKFELLQLLEYFSQKWLQRFS